MYIKWELFNMSHSSIPVTDYVYSTGIILTVFLLLASGLIIYALQYITLFSFTLFSCL